MLALHLHTHLILCGKIGNQRYLVNAMKKRSDCKRYCCHGRCIKDHHVALARIDGIARLISPSQSGPTSSHHGGVSSAVDVRKPHKLELLVLHFMAIGINHIDGFIKSFSCILS